MPPPLMKLTSSSSSLDRSSSSSMSRLSETFSASLLLKLGYWRRKRQR